MRTFLFILSTAALVVPLSAQNACPCVPLTHLWIVKTCPDWNCVNTELLLANGDPQVIALDGQQTARTDPGIDDRGRQAPTRGLQHLRPKII